MTEEELMLTAILGCPRIDLLTRSVPLNASQKSQLAEMRNRRSRGEPLQYIVGFTEFMGLRINVDPNVLIPRPETEFLVEKIFSRVRHFKKSLKILDIGTGSGCIAITLAHFLTESQVTAFDVSEAAIVVARQNAIQNHVEKKIQFFCAPELKFLYDNDGKRYDVVVSNPPYIPTSQLAMLPQDVQQEPRMALDGGVDGLDVYRQILGGAWQVLAPGGFSAFEMGEDQQKSIEKLLIEFPYYTSPLFEKDLTGKERYFFLD